MHVTTHDVVVHSNSNSTRRFKIRSDHIRLASGQCCPGASSKISRHGYSYSCIKQQGVAKRSAMGYRRRVHGVPLIHVQGLHGSATAQSNLEFYVVMLPRALTDVRLALQRMAPTPENRVPANACPERNRRARKKDGQAAQEAEGG
jgi:hypothetical protein